MKKNIFIIITSLLLTSCSFFKPHKLDIEQGNIVTETQVNELHRGMTTGQVKNILGQPVLINLFSPNRIDYVYTMKMGRNQTTISKVSCTFNNNKLVNIQRN
jgi:outer membrane protein assembly factor BamE